MVPNTFLQPCMTAFQPALPGWLEQFDRVAVGIFNLDLSATGSRFHLVAEMDPGLLERGDAGWQVGNFQHHPIPSSRLLCLTSRHRSWDAPGPLRRICASPSETFA